MRPARRWARTAAVLLAATPFALSACDGSGAGPRTGDGVEGLVLETVVEGLDEPVYLTAPAGDPRLFVVERTGAIRVVSASGSLLPTPFLDLSAGIRSSGSEQGLLGLAFHPDYAANGRFYVNFTDAAGHTRVVEHSAEPGSDVADSGPGRLLLQVAQPFSNHNGGQVSFGPDGLLYVGLGDGGAAGDPQRNGQDRGTLLGTILRIDVDGGAPYAIPPDNPFVGDPEAREEIWAWGLRNPWRFAWDGDRGLLFVADVGQNRWEEVNVAPSGAAGVNYGWPIMEGQECFTSLSCADEGLHPPGIVYGHGDGCSVTGGVAYRGSDVPALADRYLFADFCEGWIRAAAVAEDGSVVEVEELDLDRPGSITSFGEDADGEVYVLVQEGRVLRLREAGGSP